MELEDVTLREGSQMPGRAYSADQLVEAGLELDSLGLTYIQAGFAITGDRDREVIERLSAEADASIVSIARALSRDVEAALGASADVVDLISPVSDRQLEHTVGKTREEMLAAMRDAVDRIDGSGRRAHLTIVDAFRTDPALVADVFAAFDRVEYVTLADTVGAATPRSVSSFLDSLEERGVDPGRAGVHLHDDLGLATANALVAADRGVEKVDVSVASLGERAGNAALEQLVVAGTLDYGEPFDVGHERLIETCETVLSILDESVDPRRAILGEEVTTHESGIHTAAMLSDPSVMEPFDPGRFGGSRTLLFGEKTGTSGARTLLELAGRSPTDELIEAFGDRLASEGPLDRAEALELAERVSPEGDDAPRP